MSSGFGVLDQVTRDVWDKRSASPEVEQQSQLSLTTEGSLSFRSLSALHGMCAMGDRPARAQCRSDENGLGDLRIQRACLSRLV